MVCSCFWPFSMHPSQDVVYPIQQQLSTSTLLFRENKSVFDISHGDKEAAGGDQEHGRRFKPPRSFERDGVPRSTTNLACYGKLGRTPILIKKKILMVDTSCTVYNSFGELHSPSG